MLRDREAKELLPGPDVISESHDDRRSPAIVRGQWRGSGQHLEPAPDHIAGNHGYQDRSTRPKLLQLFLNRLLVPFFAASTSFGLPTFTVNQ